jgi:serine/threonine-protein kinase RsbW
MKAEIQLQLTGELDILRTVWQSCEALLESLEFDEDPVQTRCNLQLALSEALTNVLRHGYADGGEPWIGLRLMVQDAQLFIEIRDRARPFDPTGFDTEPDFENGEMIPEGGYGLMIMRQVTDDMHYSREGNENVLTLQKAISLQPV